MKFLNTLVASAAFAIATLAPFGQVQAKAMLGLAPDPSVIVGAAVVSMSAVPVTRTTLVGRVVTRTSFRRW